MDNKLKEKLLELVEIYLNKDEKVKESAIVSEIIDMLDKNYDI